MLHRQKKDEQNPTVAYKNYFVSIDYKVFLRYNNNRKVNFAYRKMQQKGEEYRDDNE